MLSMAEELYFDSFRESKELFKLRHAAYGALLISPLYLLSGKKITNNYWEQSRMLQVSKYLFNSFSENDGSQYSKALGNNKSQPLVRVEMELWKALLTVARGRDTMFAAMQNFYSTITSDELEAVEIVDRAFYSSSVYSFLR